MAQYVDLPGVKGGKLEGPMARSVTGFMAALRTNRICSAAGDHGAVTVWQDDEGAWRCDFCRHRMTVAEATVGTKTQVRDWLREWMPKCH